jgi:hypothetical protein
MKKADKKNGKKGPQKIRRGKEIIIQIKKESEGGKRRFRGSTTKFSHCMQIIYNLTWKKSFGFRPGNSLLLTPALRLHMTLHRS